MTIPSSFTATATSLLARLATRTNRIELIHTPHDHWPFPHPSTKHKHKFNDNAIRISVLDSSFNPPTLAHLALANAPPEANGAYDARLLLLSVRNADKALGQGDATYIQRLEMMYLLAQDINSSHLLGTHFQGSNSNSNVAIAIIDEPRFIGKSTALLAFLHSRLSSFTHLPHNLPNPAPKLTFLLGIDTLERLFSPRYYPPTHSEEGMLASLRYFFVEEGSRVVCARRDPSSYPSSRGESEALREDPAIPPAATEFLLANQITLIDIGADEQAYSSSQVRGERFGEGEKAGWKKLVSVRIRQYIEERGIYFE